MAATLTGIQIAECLRALAPESTATGAVDVVASLSSSGGGSGAWLRNLNGTMSLRGGGILLHRFDLDAKLSRFESSQGIDLMDVGSFLLVGPLGVAVTKGYDFARLLGGSGGSTQIDSLVSSWDVRDGVLHASDVAMATPRHRIALKGNLDFVNQRFDSVVVALVDDDGCAKVRQELRGTFREPELSKPTVLAALIGPARRVLETAKDLLPGGPCTVFYQGAVRPPE